MTVFHDFSKQIKEKYKAKKEILTVISIKQNIYKNRKQRRVQFFKNKEK